MPKAYLAYLDTTVLTDILLKIGEPQEQARAAVHSFETSQLPVYAIKEFKRGPLKNFSWFYNKIVTTNDFSKAMAALHAVSRTPMRYLTSTALEAAVTACTSIAPATLGELVAKYGEEAEQGNVYRDEMRLALKRQIYKAWFSRRSVTTETVGPLSCYREEAPYEKRGLIELDPKKCDRELTCCLAASLRSMKDDLEKLKTAIDEGGSIREEDRRRAKALRHVYRTKAAVTDEVCRHLGDAVIVAYAPRDATILTTNLKDHTLLANAIGRTVASPRSVIEMAKSGG